MKSGPNVPMTSTIKLFLGPPFLGVKKWNLKIDSLAKE